MARSLQGTWGERGHMPAGGSSLSGPLSGLGVGACPWDVISLSDPHPELCPPPPEARMGPCSLQRACRVAAERVPAGVGWAVGSALCPVSFRLHGGHACLCPSQRARGRARRWAVLSSPAHGDC